MAKYRFKARTTKAKKQFEKLKSKGDFVIKKLKELQEDPRKRKGAYRLKQNLKGYWGAKISENPDLRITYKIDEENKFIIVYAAGSHKEAYKL